MLAEEQANTWIVWHNVEFFVMLSACSALMDQHNSQPASMMLPVPVPGAQGAFSALILTLSGQISVSAFSSMYWGQ